jgi:hypothetical protein
LPRATPWPFCAVPWCPSSSRSAFITGFIPPLPARTVRWRQAALMTLCSSDVRPSHRYPAASRIPLLPVASACMSQPEAGHRSTPLSCAFDWRWRMRLDRAFGCVSPRKIRLRNQAFPNVRSATPSRSFSSKSAW